MDGWLITEILKSGVPPIAVAVLVYFGRELSKMEKRLEGVADQVARLDKKCAVVIARLNLAEGRRGQQHGPGFDEIENGS